MGTARWCLVVCAWIAAALWLVGCDPAGDDDDSADPGPDPIHVDIDAECDNVNPLYCMLPWPSSRYLEADDTTNTGWRLAYEPEAFPMNINDDAFDVEPYARFDGFPPSAQILTLFDKPVDASTLPPWSNYDASLEDGSPTVLLDMESGERVAHFAEFDVRAEYDSEILLYIRPAKRLDEDRRYAVAIRDLEYTDGTPVEASEVFAALRDGVITDAEQVEARRPGFEEMFTALETAGVAREHLIQAWDFRTASGEAIWGDLLFMRDDAMDRLDADGGGCTVTEVQDEYNEEYYRRIDGTITVPLYMDSPYAPASLVRDADGNPSYQGDYEVAFVAYIPRSLAEPGADPGRLMTYGHGFFGSEDEVGTGWLRDQANTYGFVTTGTDWDGMSEYDVAPAAAALANVSEFPHVTQRLMQGVINFLALTRTVAGLCWEDPAFQVNGQTAFDPTELYYMGMSQGSIMGATTMALSQDIERAVLNVGAANYPLMESRSQNFDEFELIYSAWYTERIDREFYWSVMGSLWEQSDPITYLPHLISDPLPGSPAKKILYQIGQYDSQVCNIASDVAARTAGFTEVRPANHDIWGLEEASPGTDDGFDGSAIQYWYCNDPESPPGNEPPSSTEAHECVRRTETAQIQTDRFLRSEGVVINPCGGECIQE